VRPKKNSDVGRKSVAGSSHGRRNVMEEEEEEEQEEEAVDQKYL